MVHQQPLHYNPRCDLLFYRRRHHAYQPPLPSPPDLLPQKKAQGQVEDQAEDQEGAVEAVGQLASPIALYSISS